MTLYGLGTEAAAKKNHLKIPSCLTQINVQDAKQMDAWIVWINEY